MSIYAFCCVNNKFNCLLVVFTTFWYSFSLPSLPWRYVWTVESHNLLPFLTRFLFLVCSTFFFIFDALTSRWSGFHSQWDFGGNYLSIYLFFFFQDHFHQHPTLFISQLHLFDWYFLLKLFLFYFIIMRRDIFR